MDIEKLIKAADLASLAEQAGTVLHQAGRDLRGPCPLHGGDNQTAFRLYEDGDRMRWRCYTGCTNPPGGDVLDFVMAWKGMDFEAAVKELAQMAGISLTEIGYRPQDAQAERKRRQRRDLLDEAARFYARQLWSAAGEQALAYARRRGFSDEIIALAGWGFSDGSGRLAEHLRAGRFDLELAREIGLLRKDGLDFTANASGREASPAGWLIYPHQHTPGQQKRCPTCGESTWHCAGTCLRHNRSEQALSGVHYLSARALSPADPADKSRNLPGERQVYRAEVSGDAHLILVEGQADAESLRQLGFSAWALCGLGSLPEAERRALHRRKAVYLALDNDEHLPGTSEEQDQRRQRQAGQRARLAGEIGPLAMIPPALPEGSKDFNDWLQAGATAEMVAALLKDARPWIEALLDGAGEWLPHELDERVRSFLGLVSSLPDVLKGRYLRLAESRLNIPASDLRAALKESAAEDEAGEDELHLVEVREGKLWFAGEALGNFSARITGELIMDDGQNTPDVRYTLNGRLATGEPLEEIEILSEEFESIRWLARWGARAWTYISPGRMWLLARAIKELSVPELKRERVYTFGGWASVQGQHAFLTSGGAITANGHDPSVRVDLGDNNLRYYNLPVPPADPRPAIQASLEFLHLAPLRVTAPLWAAMYAAPLGPFMHLNAVIWVYGGTQSRKSTLTMLALTHFGPDFIIPRNKEFRAPADWMSTVTSLEGGMFAAKDLPFVIDDYAPQHLTATESRTLARVANRVVRSVGNRSSRGRANADLSERLLRPPRGLVIGTAELPLVGQSIEARMIYVPVDRDDIPISGDGCGPLDRAQTLAGAGSGLYAQAMSAYLRWIAGNWEALGKQIEADYAAADIAARSQFPSDQSRLVDYYATLSTSVRSALRFALQHQAITQAQAAALYQEISAAFVELLTSQGRRVSGQSPVIRFFEALSDLLAQSRVYLDPRLSPRGATPPLPPSGAQMIGWYGFDEENQPHLYLLTNACLQVVKEYWERVGESYDTLPDALRRQLAQADVLQQRDPRQVEASVWIGSANRTQRVLVVDVSRASRLMSGVTLWPYAPEDEESGGEKTA